MEETIYKIFDSDKRFLTKREIINRMLDLGYDEDKVKSTICFLDDSDLFINIDKYYSKISKKKIQKLDNYEKIRIAVRRLIKNKKINTYGNLNITEYKYLKNNIKEELIKLGMSDEIVQECMKSIDNNSDKSYDSDRYIISNKKENKSRLIYNKVLYKLKNIFILYKGNILYYCIRKISTKEDKIFFNDKKYYHNIVYEYYSMKNNQLICDSLNHDYTIMPLELYKGIKKKDAIISFKDVKKNLKIKKSYN